MSEKGWKAFWLGVVAAVVATVVGGIILFSVENPIKDRLKKPAKRLSYGVTEVTKIYKRPSDTNLVVQVLMGTNQIPVESMWGYRVRIWNSGAEPLKDLDVQFNLSTNSSFYCLAERHNPQPVDEVGAINLLSGNQVRTNHYQLLNPDHSDEVFFVVNMPIDMRVSARGEGLQLKREELAQPEIQMQSWKTWAIAAVIGFFLMTASSFAGELMKDWYVKRRAITHPPKTDMEELDELITSIEKNQKVAERLTPEVLAKIAELNAKADKKKGDKSKRV